MLLFVVNVKKHLNEIEVPKVQRTKISVPPILSQRIKFIQEIKEDPEQFDIYTSDLLSAYEQQKNKRKIKE